MRLSRSEWKMSGETTLRALLDQTEWLHRKGLLDQAMKVLRKGVKEAKSLEAFAYEAEFLQWQRRLFKWRGGKHLLKTLDKISRDEERALQKRLLEARLRGLRSQFQALLLLSEVTTPRQMEKEVKKLLASPELKSPPPTIQFSSFQAFYYCKAYSFMLLGKDAQARSTFLTLLLAWNMKLHSIKKEPRQFLQTVSIFTDISLRLNLVSKIEPWIEKFDDIKVKDKADQAWMLFNSHHLHLRYAMVTGRLLNAVNRSQQLEKGMVTFRQYLPTSSALIFRFNLGVLHFFAGKEKEALRHFTILRNLPAQHLRKDVIDAARLIEVLIHLDKGDFDLVDYLLRSPARGLKKGATGLFQIVQRFAKSIENLESGKNPVPHLKKLLEECETMPQVTGLAELKVWLKAGIQKVPMETILRAGGGL
jgi:hypothetical protein